MITLDLPPKAEQMLIQYAQKQGVSVQQYILSKLDLGLIKTRNSDWNDFSALQDKLFAEDPKEFELFEFNRLFSS